MKVRWYQLAVSGFFILILCSKNLKFHFDLSTKEAWEVEQTGSMGFDASVAGAADKATKPKSDAPKPAAQVGNNPYAPASLGELDDDQNITYIRHYAPLAVSEMHRSGIPASITMAQAIIESRSGSSPMAKKINNHFGMKCFSRTCKRGHCTNFTDDTHKDFFINFKKPEESYRAHSQLLSGHHYQSLFEHKGDYRAWAKGLRELGYATNPSYDRKLIEVIEHYKLYKLDKR
jgi:flagellum-specific peptidoglycan hydrolase FlgJ